MKIKNIILTSAAVIPFLAGCISRPTALPPVGPNPSSSASAGSGGYLQVFSATETRADELVTSDYHGFSHPHSSYDIRDQSGRSVKFVANHAGSMDENPDQVKLPTGQYTIVAQSSSCGLVTVPVRIEQGRTTAIHLDGNWFPSAKSSPGQLVSLSNGEAVGWSSSPAKSSN